MSPRHVHFIPKKKLNVKKSLKKQSECVFSGRWSLDRCVWCANSTTNIFIISAWKWVLLCREWNFKLAGKNSSVQISKLKGGGGGCRRQISSITYQVLGCCRFLSKTGKFTVHLKLNHGLQDSLGPTSCTTVWQQSRQRDYGCIIVKCDPPLLSIFQSRFAGVCLKLHFHCRCFFCPFLLSSSAQFD